MLNTTLRITPQGNNIVKYNRTPIIYRGILEDKGEFRNIQEV